MAAIAASLESDDDLRAGSEQAWQETLPDGSSILIRPMRGEDAALERAFVDNLSLESREYRFLGQVRMDDEAITRLTTIDYERDMAFVALASEGGASTEVGVSRFYASDDGDSCECAVTVSDAWQHRGLGTVLMLHLIGVARQRGIKRMFSIDATNNVPMHKLAESLGFKRSVYADFPSEVVHSLML